MSTEIKKEIKLEIAHVLFIDIQQEQTEKTEMKEISLLPPVSRFCVRSGTSYHAMVNAVCDIVLKFY